MKRFLPFYLLICFFCIQALVAGAQRILPPEGRIVYQVSSASTDALDLRPVVREFHVTYNEFYIREEFIDEPHRFTITNRHTQRKRYAAGYFENIPTEIEEDVSPQQFHTVESVQLRNIGGLSSQLYIVFVNNRWTDIFVHTSPVLSYPEVLGLQGLATEFSMPSEHGMLHYRVSRVEAVNFEDEWFNFETLHRISPSIPVKPAEAPVVQVEIRTQTFEQSRDQALTLIDKIQEAGSLRRMLAHGHLDDRYVNALASERKLLEQLRTEDKRLRSMVEEFRATQEGRGMDAEALLFLSEAARTRRIIAHVIETAETDLKKAVPGRPDRPARESTPAMSWRSTPAPAMEVKPEPEQPPVTKPSAAITERETALQPIPDPISGTGEEKGETEDSGTIAEPGQPVKQTVIHEKTTDSDLGNEEETSGDIVMQPLSTDKAPSESVQDAAHSEEVQMPVVKDNRQPSESVRDEADDHSERGLDRVSGESEEQRGGFVSLLDFVNRQAHAERGQPEAPSEPVASLRNVSSTAHVHGMYMDGSSFNLGDYYGKVVVLNFWFIACRPCIVEIPKLNDLKKEFGAEGVVFIAFALDGKDRLEEFLQRYPFDYRIVPGAMDIASQFGVSTYPTHIVLDRQGNLVLAENGFTDHVRQKMTETIARALGD